jgi:pyruvate dehydrogenase E2 component (dihydrolipoamide acetyltransferase)
MAFEFKLPDVGEGLHEAELLRWAVKVGDTVREDEPLLEVQTDKAAVEITSPSAGKVLELRGKEGDILHVGDVVIVIDDGSGPPTAVGIPQPETVVGERKADAHGKGDILPEKAGPAASAADGGFRRALATPAVRRLARELGIEIQNVPGTGPNGRVTADDLRAFGGRQAPRDPAVPTVTAGPAVERLPLRGVRRVIAERMVRSKRTAPHVTTVDEVDLTELVRIRTAGKEAAATRGVRLTYLPFIMKALVPALREFPYLNAQIDDERQEIVLLRSYHVGFAVDTPNGLFVPVVHDVDRKSVLQIATEIQSLTARAQAGKLSPEEMRGGTFTISNQGSVGGLFFTPVINHPEVAILGVGSIVDRPVVREGQIVIGKMAYLALSFDHRLIDGAVATRFLTRVVTLLANPTLLMMEMM